MFKFKFLFMRALVFQPILLTIRLFLLKRTFKIVVKNALIGCFILIYLFKSIDRKSTRLNSSHVD